MKQQDYEWLDANRQLLGNVRMTRPQLDRLFSIYNAITGENRPITSCGRCVLNIKKRLRTEYDKERSKD